MQFVMGERVLLPGQVVGLHNAGREESMQVIVVQLGDGQGVQTNPRNLRPIEAPPEPIVTDAETLHQGRIEALEAAVEAAEKAQAEAIAARTIAEGAYQQMLEERDAARQEIAAHQAAEQRMEQEVKNLKARLKAPEDKAVHAAPETK